MEVNIKSLEFSGKLIDFKEYLKLATLFIETGTCFGRTVDIALADGYKKVKSVELWEPFYKNMLKKYEGNKSVELFFGKSTDQLPKMLADVKEPAVFWLDAHPSGPNTAGHEELMAEGGNSEASQDNVLTKEIDIILSHNDKKHIIIIDDQNGFNESSAMFMKQISARAPWYKFIFMDEQMGPTFYQNKILVCSPY